MKISTFFFILGYLISLVFSYVYNADLRAVAWLYMSQTIIILIGWTFTCLIYAYFGKYKDRTKLVPFKKACLQIPISNLFLSIWAVILPYIALNIVITNIPTETFKFLLPISGFFALGYILECSKYLLKIKSQYISQGVLLQESQGLFRLVLIFFLLPIILYFTDEGRSAGNFIGVFLTVSTICILEYLFELRTKALKPYLLAEKKHLNIYLDASDLQLKTEKGLPVDAKKYS